MTNGMSGADLTRRVATPRVFGAGIRGLKPTATIIGTLRARAARERGRGFVREFGRCRGATPDGSRGFQPTVTARRRGVRRVATGDPRSYRDNMIVAVGFNPRFSGGRKGTVASRRVNGDTGRSAEFMYHDATPRVFGAVICGLKPTAMIVGTLRIRACENHAEVFREV